MWLKIKLRTRIYIILSTLLFITFMGGVVTVWYTYRMERLTNFIIDRSLSAFEAAEELEIDLATQEGFVSYFSIDGDPFWIEKLEKRRRTSSTEMAQALSLAETKEQKQVLKALASEYKRYTAAIDKVIQHYHAGERKKGRRLHEILRASFLKILDLAKKHKDMYKTSIQQVRKKSYAQAGKLRLVAVTAILVVVFLGILLAFVLIHDILEPVRRLAQETDRDKKLPRSRDEVRALKKGVHGLMEEYDQTSVELEKSREHLFHAEKLAMAGKLAAGTAHSIRNPLTSVKMRLFSLSRSLNLNAIQQET